MAPKRTSSTGVFHRASTGYLGPFGSTLSGFAYGLTLRRCGASALAARAPVEMIVKPLLLATLRCVRHPAHLGGHLADVRHGHGAAAAEPSAARGSVASLALSAALGAGVKLLRR